MAVIRTPTEERPPRMQATFTLVFLKALAAAAEAVISLWNARPLLGSRPRDS